MTNNKQQTEMNKEFIPYELALELNQLGFNKPCLATIDQTDFIHIKGTEYPIRGAMIYDTIDCPTYSQAFRWFREKYGLYSIVDIDSPPITFYYVITKKTQGGIGVQNEKFNFNTYEEAELACLKKLIEIVKQK